MTLLQHAYRTVIQYLPMVRTRRGRAARRDRRPSSPSRRRPPAARRPTCVPGTAPSAGAAIVPPRQPKLTADRRLAGGWRPAACMRSTTTTMTALGAASSFVVGCGATMEVGITYERERVGAIVHLVPTFYRET